MLKIGITGGIGSGKTTVCNIFGRLGIPVYSADLRAREIMNTDPKLASALKKEFGNDIYDNNGELIRPLLAQRVFGNTANVEKLNALVHPAVLEDFRVWAQRQKNTPYVLKEAALMFESGSYKEMDVMIGVSAPENIRISRAMRREGMTREKVMQRIASQMDDTEKMSCCDYIIMNDDNTAIIPQVLQVHQALLGKSA